MKMDRQSMIKELIKFHLRDKDDLSYIEDMFKVGHVGYDNYTDDELLDEYKLFEDEILTSTK